MEVRDGFSRPVSTDHPSSSPSPLKGEGIHEKETLMGSSKPKWLIKQLRRKVHDARRAARAKNPGTKNLGVERIARHGGANKRAHP